MKRSGQASILLLVLFAAALFSLGRQVTDDGVVEDWVLGFHVLAVLIIGVGLYLVRERTHPAQLWPEDLDDVWPDEEEEAPEPIEPTEVLAPVDVEVDLTGQAPVPCTNRRFHAAHDGCPGRSGRRKAATGG